jgi:hypothetical protein
MSKSTVYKIFGAIAYVVMITFCIMYLSIYSKNKQLVQSNDIWTISTLVDDGQDRTHVLSYYIGHDETNALSMNYNWIHTNVPNSKIIHVIWKKVERPVN